MEEIKVNCIVAIDPGSSGGIAIKTPGNTEILKMHKDLKSFSAFVRQIKEAYTRPIFIIEHQALRGQDIRETKDPKKAGKIFNIQKFIGEYNKLIAVLEVENVVFVKVPPITWQAGLGFSRQGLTGTSAKTGYKDRKELFKRYAAQACPGIKVTLWNADALCIMVWGLKAIALAPQEIRKRIAPATYKILTA